MVQFFRLLAWRRWLGLVFLIGVLHASAYAILVPAWQAPDEPGHFEYACLLNPIGRPLARRDISISLQQEIIASLARNDFWHQVREPWPAQQISSFADDPFLAKSGRQVGDEPRLYYLAPVIICQAALSIEARLRLIRLFGALLFGLTGAIAAWGLQVESDYQVRMSNDDLLRPLHRGDTLSVLAVLVSGGMVLFPMAAFVSGSVNNDALAILTATALFAGTTRIINLGWSKRRCLGLVLLLALALLSKKTNYFLALWLVLLGSASIVRYLTSRLHPIRLSFHRRLHLGRRLVALVTLLLALIVFLSLNSPESVAWWSHQQPLTAGRFRLESSNNVLGEWAYLVVDRSGRDYGRVFQVIKGTKGQDLADQTIEATALVRSIDGKPQPGRLTLRDETDISQVQFVATDVWQRVSLEHHVSPEATYVKIAVAPGYGEDPSETGRLLVDNATIQQSHTGNILSNSGFEQPSSWGNWMMAHTWLHPENPLVPLVVQAFRSLTAELRGLRHLIYPLIFRWNELRPQLLAADNYSPAMLGRYGVFTALSFAGFWGNFGWLQRPLPVWLYAGLAGISFLAVLGLLLSLRTISTKLRRLATAWLLALALVTAQTFLPMIGRSWQPQGRYLFPALFPIMGLAIIGLSHWFRNRRQPSGFVAIVALVLAFDVYCVFLASHAL